MTITRDGKQIELTQEELLKAWNVMEQNRLYSLAESMIDDNGYSFDTFADFGYESAQDFRQDFISTVLTSFTEKLEAEFNVYDSLMNDTVTSTAEDFDLEPEF